MAAFFVGEFGEASFEHERGRCLLAGRRQGRRLGCLYVCSACLLFCRLFVVVAGEAMLAFLGGVRDPRPLVQRAIVALVR